MTLIEAASDIVSRLTALGLRATIGRMSPITTIWAGTSERDEEDVARVSEEGGAVIVHFRPLKLGRTEALRGRKVPAVATATTQDRCEAIAARFRQHAEYRVAQAKAWDAVDALKSMGVSAMAREGRVIVEMEFAPEDATVVGPQLATMMKRGAAVPRG